MFVLFDLRILFWGTYLTGGEQYLIRKTDMYTKKLITVLFYNRKKKWEQPNNMRTIICNGVRAMHGWSHIQGVCRPEPKNIQKISLKLYF